MTTAHKFTFRGLAVFAFLCFAYAVAVLGFQWLHFSCTAERRNAIWLAAVWAIGPPIWFAFERWKWGTENEKELDAAQEHARDFWLGLGAIVLFLADKRF